MVNFLIHRPIATLMSTLAIIILGILATGYIPISLMPDIDIPEITVQVSAENMSARELEDAIVKPLRSQLMQLNHLEDMTSESSNGLAIIRLSFTHGTKIDYSFIEVNEKIDRAMGNMPRDLERPKVIKASASDIPVFYLNLTLKKDKAIASNGEVTQAFVDFNRFVTQVVRKRIEQIPEVAMVDVSGQVFPEIVVIPKKTDMVALGISLDDLEATIKKEDLKIGSILVKDSQYQYNLRLGNTLANIQDIEDIYIQKDGRLFQLKDLATVIEKPQKRKGLVVSNGKEAVVMAIIKQSDARMGDLKKTLNVAIVQMEKDYPEIGFSVTRDQTKLLDYAIGNLGQSLFWGMLLAFLVMFLFLKDVKSPLLIGISLPVSMVCSLLFFHILHISINIISLSGLVLGVGLMIDNSIIVIDNITQLRERGVSLSQACIKGVNEVTKPLLSSALTTCAVFVPLIFLSGITGALFYDQAMAISIGLFVSLLISITLIPVLYRLFHQKKGRLHRAGSFVKNLNPLDYASLYEKGFRFTMKKQLIVLALFLLLTLTTVGMYLWLPKAQMPDITSSETLVELDWNEPINIEENKKRIMNLLEPVKNKVLDYNALVGHQQFLLDKNADAKTSETALYLNAKSPKFLDSIKHFLNSSVTKAYPRASIAYKEVDNIFNLIFSDDAPPLTARIRNIGNVGSTQNQNLKEIWGSIKSRLPKITIQPISWENHLALWADKEKLMTYGISANQLSNTLKNAFNEKEVLSIVDNQEFVPVILGAKEKPIQDVINSTMVRANDSTYYNVGEFVNETTNKDLKTITAGREGEYYPIDLWIGQDQERQVTNTIRSVVDNNPQYDVFFTGSLFKNRQLIRELAMVLGITLLLLYFILATQFESLALPIIILLEIPISMAGAFLSLALAGMGINLMSMIGLVVMSGIVINDSILKIDTVIQLQNEGYPLLKALLVAGQRRLKPILMTSLTTILALVPMLFTGGLGGELQAPLAVALIGGMVVGTLVSLYFIPLCYYYLVKKKSHAT